MHTSKHLRHKVKNIQAIDNIRKLTTLDHCSLNLYILNVELRDVVTDLHVVPDLGHNLATLRTHVPSLVVNPLHVQPHITLLAEGSSTLGTRILFGVRVYLTHVR